MNLTQIVSLEECLITRMWGFTPETWGAVGFPSPGTTHKWVALGRPLYVVSFVSHHAAEHINEEERGRVLGVYELQPDVVNLEQDDVLSPQYLSNPTMRREDGSFRWQVGLRASRAWRFQPHAPLTRQTLPVSRTLGREVSIDMVPIPAEDYTLLSQETYRLIEVNVYGVPFAGVRVADPVAVPDQVYVFACAKKAILQRLPDWAPGEILVKVGCASDVEGRLAALNADPIARIFGLKLSTGAKLFVGIGSALSREAQFLARAAELGRPACDITTEFFFMVPEAYEKLITEMSIVLQVA